MQNLSHDTKGESRKNRQVQTQNEFDLVMKKINIGGIIIAESVFNTQIHSVENRDLNP